MTGRPSSYTQEIGDAICERIAEGESLRSICGAEDMPSKSAVFRWLATDLTFRDQYARAKEAQAEALADEIMDIADDGSNDWMEKEHGPVLDAEHVQRSKLRIEARKWVAAKLLPKKYGDKVALTGADDGPLQVVIQRFSE